MKGCSSAAAEASATDRQLLRQIANVGIGGGQREEAQSLGDHSVAQFADGAQLAQFGENAREVVGLLLRFAVVHRVVLQRTDDLRLQLVHFAEILDAAST